MGFNKFIVSCVHNYNSIIIQNSFTNQKKKKKKVPRASTTQIFFESTRISYTQFYLNIWFQLYKCLEATFMESKEPLCNFRGEDNMPIFELKYLTRTVGR